MKDLIQTIRRLQYRLFSNSRIVQGRPLIEQPVLFDGKGKIVFRGDVHLGYRRSPGYYAGYIYMEVRTPEAVIEIQEGTYLNNNCSIISVGPGISIGRVCLIGPEVMIMDSDIHGIENRQQPAQGPVSIGDDVFIGARAVILKGVRIGDHATIAAGAVVTRDVPARSVAAGNPARVVKELT